MDPCKRDTSKFVEMSGWAVGSVNREGDAGLEDGGVSTSAERRCGDFSDILEAFLFHAAISPLFFAIALLRDLRPPLVQNGPCNRDHQSLGMDRSSSSSGCFSTRRRFLGHVEGKCEIVFLDIDIHAPALPQRAKQQRIA